MELLGKVIIRGRNYTYCTKMMELRQRLKPSEDISHPENRLLIVDLKESSKSWIVPWWTVVTEDSSLLLPSLLPVVADLSFRPPPVMANSGVGSYSRFNLQKIWPMCFQHPLLPTMVEHSAPLLRSPWLWSILLVETAILVVGSGEVLWRWSFLRMDVVGCKEDEE